VLACENARQHRAASASLTTCVASIETKAGESRLTINFRAQDIDMLITRIGFPPGQPHGVALGKMARVKRRGIKVLFVGAAERLEHTQGVGEFLAAPVTARDVAAMVGEMLA
jgi:hypothetical protein